MDTITISDDTAIRQRLICDDKQALSDVYQCHSCIGLARKITRNRTLAEDLAQEVFVRLWKNTNDSLPPAAASGRTCLPRPTGEHT